MKLSVLSSLRTLEFEENRELPTEAEVKNLGLMCLDLLLGLVEGEGVAAHRL